MTVNKSKSVQEIESLVRARVPIIWVVTHEEGRFINEIVENFVVPERMMAKIWSPYLGLIPLDKYQQFNLIDEKTRPVKAVLETILDKKLNPINKEGSIYFMLDLSVALQTLDIRQLRDIYEHLAASRKTLIIVSPLIAHGPGGQKEGLPPTLDKQISVVYYELPSEEEIKQKVNYVIHGVAKAKKQGIDYTQTEIEEITRAMRGLTMVEIDNAMAVCLANNRSRLIVEELIHFKRQTIKKSQLLEFIETDLNMDDVGGLDLAKEYLSRYKNAFSEEAREFGVEPLKLIILVGIPGSGKSLLSKGLGQLYKLPLVQLDMGRLFGSLVGQSEERARTVISTLEGISPCVCWIDELEKGLSGTKSSTHTDGGTTSRVFGTLLTALQDGLNGVIFVATCNDITSIPPEFIRRANEVFFVDLPSKDERWDIFKIHLRRRGRDPLHFEDDKEDLLRASDGFTGSEIEKTVKDGIVRAFYSGAADVKTEHLLQSMSETKPLSQTMGEQIKSLQDWARDHARYASSSNQKAEEVDKNLGRFVD